MARLFWLSGEGWALVDPHLPRWQPGKPRVDNRRAASGIPHVLKTGCRWRDVPPEHGPAGTICNRDNPWSRRGLRQQWFKKVAASGPVPDGLAIDSTHVEARRSASGAEGGSGRRRSGARAVGIRVRSSPSRYD
jgi:transposase